MLWREGKTDEAIALMKRVAAMPALGVRDRAAAHHVLGSVYHNLGQASQALEQFDRGLGLLAGIPEHRDMLATMHQHASLCSESVGQHDTSARHCRAALALLDASADDPVATATRKKRKKKEK